MKQSLNHWLNKSRDHHQEIVFGDRLGWLFLLLVALGAYLWYR